MLGSSNMAHEAVPSMDAAQFIDHQLRGGKSFIMTCAPSGCKASGLLNTLCQQVAQGCQSTPTACEPVLVIQVPNDRTASEYRALINHNGLGDLKGVVAHALTSSDRRDWNRQTGALQKGCNVIIATPQAFRKACSERRIYLGKVKWFLVDGTSQILKQAPETSTSSEANQGSKLNIPWLDLSGKLPRQGVVTVLIDHHWSQTTWDRAHVITDNDLNISFSLSTTAHKCETTVSAVGRRGIVHKLVNLIGRGTTDGNWCLIFVNTVPEMHRLKNLINQRTDLAYNAEIIHPSYPGDPCDNALNKLFHENVEILIACHALAIPQIDSIERVILAGLPLLDDGDDQLDIDEFCARINWGRIPEHGGTGFWFLDTKILMTKQAQQISALRTLLHLSRAEADMNESPEGLPLAPPNVILSYRSSDGRVTQPLNDEGIDQIASPKPVDTSLAGDDEEH